MLAENVSPPQTPTKGPRLERAKSLISQHSTAHRLPVDNAGHDPAKAPNSCSVYCWGRGQNGRLGTGDLHSRLEPVVIMHSQCKVTEVACGSLHSLLLLEDHRVFAWGEGQHGQLAIAGREALAAQPQLVTSLQGRSVCHISAGGLSSAAGLLHSKFSFVMPCSSNVDHLRCLTVTDDGHLLCWGDNSKGKLGLGTLAKSKDRIFEPLPISECWEPQEKTYVRCHFTRVWIGKRHCAASEKNGGFLTWGENSKGQLGLGDRTSKSYPVYVQGLRNVCEVSLGLSHSAAIDARSMLYTWGDAGEGRLGHGEKYKEEKSGNADRTLKERRLVDAILEPSMVEFFRTKKIGIISVACGDRFTIVVDSEGSVWSWGSGVFGQLGLGADAIMSVEHPSKISPAHLRDRSFEQQNARYLLSPFQDEITSDSFLNTCESFQTSPSPSLTSMEEGETVDTQDYQATALVRCGPAHVVFSNGRGKLWSWGRADFGLLGTALQDKAFWPTRVTALTRKRLCGLATGDSHCVAVVFESPETIIDAEYELHQVSGSDGDKVMLASRPMQANDSRLRFEATAGPKPRCGECDLFKNVTGVTEDGQVRVNVGGKSEVVIDASQLQISRALSASTILREIPKHLGESVQAVDPVMNITYKELIEEMETPHFFAPNIRIGDYAPEWKSTWEKYSQETLGHKATSDSPNELSMVVPESPQNVQTNERRNSFWKSMAFEDGMLHHENYIEYVEAKRYRELHAHSRSMSSSKNLGSPCSALLGTGERAPIEINCSNPGPGAYTPRILSYGSIPTQKTLLKPCGIGVTLTSKRNQRDSRFFDTIVKEVLPGGSTDILNQSADICLAPNDIIIAINGVKVTNVFMARKLLMGNPGEEVRIRYRHRDSRTALSSYAEMTIPRSYGQKEPLKSIARASQAGFVGTDYYVGLGLKSERFSKRNSCNILTPAQKQAILAIVEDLRNKDVKDVDLLKNRHSMIPPLVGIRRVIDRIVSLYPEWEADVRRPGVLWSLFQQGGLMQGDPLHELGPGHYKPLNTGVHNWTEEKKPAAQFVNMASTHGPLVWHKPRPLQKSLTAAESMALEDEIRKLAEIHVFGRVLTPEEFQMMNHKELRCFNDAWIRLKRASGNSESPGPCHYELDSQLNTEFQSSPSFTSSFKSKGRESPKKVDCTPGPGHYDLRREDLSWSGDFANLQGSKTSIYRPNLSPQRPISPGPFIDITKTGNLATPSIEKTTRVKSPPHISMQGRYDFEPFLGLRKEHDVYLHPSTGPAPNEYCPDQTATSRSATIHGREPIEYQTKALLKIKFDSAKNCWEQAIPGPCDYTPICLSGGEHVGSVLSHHRAIFGTSAQSSHVMDEEQASQPGPGQYDIPSMFGGTCTFPRNSAVNSGYIGERPIPVTEPESTPGPGSYRADSVEGIGSDRSCIGAAARAKYEVSSTWCIRCLKDPVFDVQRKSAEAGIEIAVASEQPRKSEFTPRPPIGMAKSSRLCSPKLSLAQISQKHPLSARADMRRGFTMCKAPRVMSARMSFEH